MSITEYVKCFYMVLLLSFLYIFLWPGCNYYENGEYNISDASSFIKSRPDENRRRSALNCIKKIELEEVLTLNWGNKEGEIGNNKEYDIKKIAHTFGFRYGPADFHVDKSGCIYIMDNFNSRVLKYKDRKLVQSYSLSLEDEFYYSKIYVDLNKNLYIVINGKELKIIKYDATGNHIYKYSLEGDIREDGLYRVEIDKNENIYILRRVEDDKTLLVKYSKNGKENSFLINKKIPFQWHLDSHGVIYALYKDKENNHCEIYCFKEDKVYSLFSFYMENSDDLYFLGLDENYIFYFYKDLIKSCVVSEGDNISEIATMSGDNIFSYEGLILYKYDIQGILLKRAVIREFIPYEIKMNLKGKIYFTPRLSTDLLLLVPLDTYRIYTVSF